MILVNKITLNKKYKPLFKNDKRYHIISGGRASGKSYSVALYILLLTLEKNNVILFSRYTMTSIGISVFPEFLEKIERLQLEHLFEITKNEIINRNTGSRIVFKGLKTGSALQTANLKSIAGLNIIVIDESEEIPDEATFDKVDLSARKDDKFNKVILLFNPTSKASWLYDRFFAREGVEPGQCIETEDINYIHTTYLDNIQYLSPSFIKQIEKIKKTDPEKYNHIIMGAFLDKSEGVIFTNWGIGDFDDELEYGFGMDYGFNTDPTTCIKVAIDVKKKIMYLDEKLYKPELTTSEIYHHIADEVGNKLIVGDNAEGRLIEELKRKKLNIIPCKKGAGSVIEGIELMKDYRIMVTPNSTNLIKELNNYIWNAKNTPIDMYNHAIDATRYYFTHRIKNPKISKFRIR